MIRNNIKKLIYTTILFATIIVLKTNNVNAASASISGSSSGTVDSPISLSVSGTAAQWNLKLVVDGTTIATSSELESVDNKTISFSGSYTPKTSGSKNVVIEGTITDADGTTTRSFSAKTITVAEKPAATTNTNVASNTPATTTTPETNNEKQETTNNKQTTSTPSSNANLSNLGISKYDFTGFKPGTTTYNTTVPNDVTSVQVYAVPQDGAVYNVTGNTNLDVGTNKITVTVTAADKKTTKTYYIYVARKEAEEKKEEEIVPNVIEEKEEEKEEEKLALTSIAIEETSEIYLEPEFKSDIFEYTINLKGDVTKIPLNAIANKADAKVEITGNENLKDGENNILITVTKGEEKAEYKIKVKKNIKTEEKKEETKVETQNEVIIAKKTKSESKPIGLYIGGGIIALFIIIIIIFIIRKRRRELKEDISSFTFGGTEEESDDESNYNNDYKEELDSEIQYESKEENKNDEYKYDDKYVDKKSEDRKYEEKHSLRKSKKGKHF